MTSELESKIYKSIHRNVIWGAEREDVLHTLSVNSITGERAEELYARARGDRIAMIRSEATRKAIKGLGSLGTSVIVWLTFGLGIGAITRTIIIICALLAVWGVWQLADGVVTALFASSKKGSIAAD